MSLCEPPAEEPRHSIQKPSQSSELLTVPPFPSSLHFLLFSLAPLLQDRRTGLCHSVTSGRSSRAGGITWEVLGLHLPVLWPPFPPSPQLFLCVGHTGQVAPPWSAGIPRPSSIPGVLKLPEHQPGGRYSTLQWVRTCLRPEIHTSPGDTEVGSLGTTL